MRSTATIKATVTVVVIGIAAFLVSGIPRFKNAKHGGNYLVGQTVWVVFLACLLALIVLAAVTAIRAARRHRVRAQAR